MIGLHLLKVSATVRCWVCGHWELLSSEYYLPVRWSLAGVSLHPCRLFHAKICVSNVSRSLGLSGVAAVRMHRAAVGANHRR